MAQDRWSADGNKLKRSDIIVAEIRDTYVYHDPFQMTRGVEYAAFIAAACNHYAAFLGSILGHEEAGSELTEQMELFSHET